MIHQRTNCPGFTFAFNLQMRGEQFAVAEMMNDSSSANLSPKSSSSSSILLKGQDQSEI